MGPSGRSLRSLSGTSPSDGRERRPERATPRFRWPECEVIFSAGPVCGRGVLYDLSMGGARIDEVSARVAPGTTIRLSFRPEAGYGLARIPGGVIRETETGFAIAFSDLPPSVRKQLALAISQVVEAG